MNTILAAIVLASAASASLVPLDTPEVALAKAKHLAIVEQTKLRNSLGASSYGAYPEPSTNGWYASGWNQWAAPVIVSNGHVQDTPEVADAKAKHLAILAAETARNSAPLGHYPDVYASGSSHSWSPSEGYLKYGPAHIVVIDGQVQDTPEVAAAKAKHVSALHEASGNYVGAW